MVAAILTSIKVAAIKLHISTSYRTRRLMTVKYACILKLENKHTPVRKKKLTNEYMDRPRPMNTEQVRNDLYFTADNDYDL